MKALVTGSTGFIGSHLVASLIRTGFDVTCLTRTSSKTEYLDGLTVKLVEGDCTDRRSLDGVVRGADYVFHLAGLTKAISDDDFFRVNAEGTRNLVTAVLNNNPNLTRFFYLSSLAAAGPSHDGKPLNEECEPRPVSVYGKTKYEGEKIVYGHRGDLPITVIRPPVVYGPRDKDLLIFFKMVKSGIIPYWGKCAYSFIYVDDLIAAIILSVMSEDAIGEIFFVSDGKIYSTDEVIDAIADAVEKKPIRVKVPQCIMPLIGLLSEKRQKVNIINTDKIKEMKYSYWICDTAKALSRLNFEPKVKIREGAKWTADWYRIHRWL